MVGFNVETKSFVKLLFDVLSSGEYDADLKAKRAADGDLAEGPGVTGSMTASSIISSHSADSVDTKTNRPGAIVQPLKVVGNNNGSSDDYRDSDVYRPGHVVQHHTESQHRRDWKRKSPQRIVSWHHHHSLSYSTSSFVILSTQLIFSILCQPVSFAMSQQHEEQCSTLYILLFFLCVFNFSVCGCFFIWLLAIVGFVIDLRAHKHHCADYFTDLHSCKCVSSWFSPNSQSPLIFNPTKSFPNFS